MYKTFDPEIPGKVPKIVQPTNKGSQSRIYMAYSQSSTHSTECIGVSSTLADAFFIFLDVFFLGSFRPEPPTMPSAVKLPRMVKER